MSETIKLITFVSQSMHNWSQYNGRDSCSMLLQQMERRANCPACSKTKTVFTLPAATTVDALLELVRENSAFQFERASVRAATGVIFLAPKRGQALAGPLAALSAANRSKTLLELGVAHGDDLEIDNRESGVTVNVLVHYS